MASPPPSSEPRAVAAGVRVAGRLRVPPSKSVTHRHLLLALLARRPFLLRRPLVADDTRRTLAALAALGWEIEEEPSAVRLQPPRRLPAEARLDCGAAGTLLRLLMGTLAALPGRWTLDGTPRLRERPVGPLAAALGELGVAVAWRGEAGHPPLEVTGRELAGGTARLAAGESSQYLSALLLAGAAARGPLRVEVSALASAPYVEVTAEVLAAWGVEVRRAGDVWEVRPAPLVRDEATVDGDWSAASYPAAAAALTAGRVELAGLAPGSAQGDRRFLEVLTAMGATVEWEGDLLVVAGPAAGLAAVDVDMGTMPDLVPTLAALAPFARGTTVIRGVPHLRLKESDRLRALASELGRLGVPARETADGLAVPGVWAAGLPATTPVTVQSWDDHRIAMSCALVGLRRPGVRVADPGVVAKSYPGFWDDLECLSNPSPRTSPS